MLTPEGEVFVDCNGEVCFQILECLTILSGCQLFCRFASCASQFNVAHTPQGFSLFCSISGQHVLKSL